MIACMTRADEMREVFARWKVSNQSLMAFGKAEGLSYKVLLYWRRKLGDEAQRGRKPSNSAELLPVRFVPDSPAVESNPGRFEVWLSNGISLDVAAGFDELELRRLVGALLTC